MDTIPLLLLLAGLAVGIGAGWLTGAARARGAAALEQRDLAMRVVAAESAAEVAHAESARQRELQRELAARQQADAVQREERERREQSVLRALTPVRDTLLTMQQKVEDLERERHGQYGAISEQLRRAHDSDEVLRATTAELAGALRSGSVRGVWGETQLRRVVEAAGLLRHVDFDLQTSLTSDAGSGRPDMVIRLPGGKSLAVDAKAPLDAFLEAAGIPDTAIGEQAVQRRALRARHVKAVRGHVDALAKRTYWAGLEESPEFVICFLPSEALLSVALDEDPSLLDYAFSRRVALASPVNLWAILKTVAHTWSHQEVSEDARKLVVLGTELYDRLGTLGGHADDLRRALDRTVESYNRFVGTLESRVLVTARRFPGVDSTKLEGTVSSVERVARRLTAPEFTQQTTADVGELRRRIDDPAV